MEVLTHIPIDLTPERVFAHLRLRDENGAAKQSTLRLLEQARPVVNAKAIYKVAYVENKKKDSLYINGAKFTGRVLRINLDQIERVFPHVITCGQEIDNLKPHTNDPIDSFMLDAIKEMILHSAINYLREYLVQKFALGQVSVMTPGSLKDWPIIQQKELFSILGNVEELIGVRLKPSFLMMPIKSVSGILFPTEIDFASCQLCPRENCIGRRAPYDTSLAKKYGIEINQVRK